MRDWKVHLGWALVTILVAGIWGRIVAPGAPPAPARPAGPRSPETSAPPAPDRPAAPPTAATPAAAPAPPAVVSEEQELRRLLAKSETWLQGFRRLRDSADEGLKSSLLTEMARSGVPSVRHNALYEFARWKGRAAAPLLMQVLRKEDEEGSLRALAARELGEVGAIEATDLLLQAFRSGGDTLPLESANSLLKLGVPGPAREVLETCARNYESPDSAVRRKAVDSASQIEHASTLPLLSRALRDSSGDVRIEAITAISYGFPSEGRVLLEPLTRDPNAEVAEAAREALEHLRDDVK